MRLLDLLLPPSCAGCGRFGHLVCRDCLAGFHRAEAPDDRFAAADPGTLVGDALELAVAAFAHGGTLRDALQRLKYGGSGRIAEPLGRAAAPALEALTRVCGALPLVPAPVHAGGLRYHGDSPSLSLLVRHGHMEARAYTQNEVFDAAIRFAHAEGIIPAPESAHGLKAVIEEADAAREADEERVILVNLSGHGYFDMQAYDDYLNGRLPDFEFDPAAEDAALAGLPDAPSLGG